MTTKPKPTAYPLIWEGTPDQLDGALAGLWVDKETGIVHAEVRIPGPPRP